MAGRLEIEHIEEIIDRKTSLPDFGYNAINFEDKENVSWGLFWEFINSNDKFERVENFISMRLEQKDDLKAQLENLEEKEAQGQ